MPRWWATPGTRCASKAAGSRARTRTGSTSPTPSPTRSRVSRNASRSSSAGSPSSMASRPRARSRSFARSAARRPPAAEAAAEQRRGRSYARLVSAETELRPVAPGATQVERLLADLNPPQREAVTHGEGPLLVLAGAGSGKTRVLTYRIAYLLATGQALPSEILAITFTNKAAGEMRERVERLVGGVSRVMWVMTFHSACARILRTDAQRLGYKRAFTIYDEAD